MEDALTKPHITWLLLIMEHFSVSALWGHGWCMCRSEQLCFPHLQPPLPTSQGQEDGWVTATKEHLKPSVCIVPVCLHACFSQCLLTPWRLIVSHSLSFYRFSYLPAYLCVCQLLPCSNNSLSPCLLTCLRACEWSHMFLLVLSQLAAWVPTYQALHPQTVILSCHSLSMLLHAYCTGW